MYLINPSFEILGNPDGMEILKAIEWAGRTCYKSENRITDDSAIIFVKKWAIDHGHETMLEHRAISVKVICDRGVSHEIVRHRIASYSQESTRYCDYSHFKEGGNITFIIPVWLKDQIEPGEYTNFVWNYNERDIWITTMMGLEKQYHTLREMGWKPEQARSVLPNSLKTEIVMTMNLREWRHFFKLRTAPAAHPQMREISQPMLEYFKAIVPVVFDDIHPEVKKAKTLPCQVGDTIYRIDPDGDIYESEITGYREGVCEPLTFICVYGDGEIDEFEADEIGKTVFLSPPKKMTF